MSPRVASRCIPNTNWHAATESAVVDGDGKSLNCEGEGSTMSNMFYLLSISNHDLEFLILDYW